MPTPKQTFMRPKNVELFLALSGRHTSAVAQDVDLSRQHAKRLIKVWREAGLIRPDGVRHVHTHEGEEVAKALSKVLEVF